MSSQPVVNPDELEIRALIERWTQAVAARELDSILDAHSDEIMMFDVPLPDVRGIGEYRESWIRMFSYLGEHGTFETTELSVTAGEDVAFCFGRLHCQGSEPGALPLSIRLTLGLRKRDGRWIVEHEHHSEPA